MKDRRKTIEILGVKIDNITADKALDKAYEILTDSKRETAMIFTPNPEIVMAAYEDESFMEILNSADMCTPDGIGIVYASKILKTPFPERVAGFDLTCGLLEKISHSGESVFLLGSKPGVADIAAKNLKEQYRGLNVAGTHHGYFSEEENEKIIQNINSSGAKLLLVCLGAPKQEKWIYSNRGKLNVRLCMGVGGAVDVFAGNVKRAPELFIKMNLEWFYRLVKQPSRIGRFAALPKFMITVMKNR